MTQLTFRLILECDFRGGRFFPGRHILVRWADYLVTCVLAEVLAKCETGGVSHA